MTTEAISKINEKYPLNLVDLIEDSSEYMDMVIEILHKNGITNIRPFDSPDKYEEALIDNPDLTPQLAFVDYRFPQSTLTGVDLTIMLVKRAKHKTLKPRVIMITGWENQRDTRRFFHKGGFAWLDKNEFDFKEQLVDMLQQAIDEIKDAYEERDIYDSLDGE